MKFAVNLPRIGKLERKYVNDTIDSNWLSSNGYHTKIFEQKISKYLNRKYAIAVQSGTAAIHAALKACDISSKDAVVTPNYSCISNLSCINQLNAKKIIVEIENETLGLDFKEFKIAWKKFRPKVVQIVHVYGHPARDTLKIINFCKNKKIKIIEDASESLGAKIGKNKVGSFGDISVFSVRSEKMIGCGEGGVILTNNKKLFEKLKLICSRHAPFRHKSDPYWKKYFINGEGYNYLMPHLLGAVSRAQIEKFEKEILNKKISVGKIYRKIFTGSDQYQFVPRLIKNTKPVFWLNAIYLKNLSKSKVRNLGYYLQKKNIEVRSGFWPLNELNYFKSFYVNSQKKSVTSNIFDKILVLPSNSNLKRKDIKFIKKEIDIYLKKNL